MRISIVLDSVTRGGAERQGIYAAGELAQLGCVVELLYYHRAEYEHDLSGLRDVKVTFLPKQGQYVRFLRRLRRHLRDGRHDVIHGFKASPSIYVGLAGGGSGAKVSLGGIRAEYDGGPFIKAAHKLVDRRLAGWVVNSRASAQAAARALVVPLERFFVVYNGISPQNFDSKLSAADAKERLGLPADSQTVSILARLDDQKNHSLFLAAAERVVKVCPRAEFLIAGEGDLKAKLQAEALERGLVAKARFLGSRSDIPDILRASDVVALTSHYEGLANVFLEAMSAGVPVVSTAYAGVDEIVTHGREGFVAPMGDPEAIAKCMTDLLSNQALRREMGERGRRLVAERFSIPAMGKCLLSVYEKCLTEA